MDNTLHAMLASWHEFYLIVGTAAAALTGLQFVVQTLIASGDARRAVTGDEAEASIAAFGTPTVVHFTLALVRSAVLSMPWPGHAGVRATLAMLDIEWKDGGATAPFNVRNQEATGKFSNAPSNDV